MNDERLKGKGQRTIVNRQWTTVNGTINVEGLELRVGSGQRRTKSRVQRTEYREQLRERTSRSDVLMF